MERMAGCLSHSRAHTGHSRVDEADSGLRRRGARNNALGGAHIRVEGLSREDSGSESSDAQHCGRRVRVEIADPRRHKARRILSAGPSQFKLGSARRCGHLNDTAAAPHLQKGKAALRRSELGHLLPASSLQPAGHSQGTCPARTWEGVGRVSKKVSDRQF